jgi:hypothetical protein
LPKSYSKSISSASPPYTLAFQSYCASGKHRSLPFTSTSVPILRMLGIAAEQARLIEQRLPAAIKSLRPR